MGQEWDGEMGGEGRIKEGRELFYLPTPPHPSPAVKKKKINGIPENPQPLVCGWSRNNGDFVWLDALDVEAP